MTKEIIQKLADSENLTLNGDLEYFDLQFMQWQQSVCGFFGCENCSLDGSGTKDADFEELTKQSAEIADKTTGDAARKSGRQDR